MNKFSLQLLTVLALAGCNNHHPEDHMPTSFHPPGIKSLSDIDVADNSYSNESVVIQGIVSPSSQGGWPGENDDYEVHCFKFAAWHRLGEPTIKQDLTILRAVPPAAYYWDDFPEYSIQRISILLSNDETRAVFEKTLSVVIPDDELQAIAEELQKPVIISTKRFGNLVLDRSIDQFESETKWNHKTIRLAFPADQEKPDEKALKTAELLWSDEVKWQQRIEKYVIKELLELKNGTWLQPGESPLTAKQFLARMALTSISISSDGEFEFWYEDSDLFGGHLIMVSGDLKNGPTDAGIHG